MTSYTADKTISFKSVYKYFINKYNKAEILNDISFDVFKGEFLSIIGPSGSGKTTLLRILSQLEDYSKGEIVYSYPEKNSNTDFFGFVFQEPLLFPWRTVEENIIFPYEIRKCDKIVSNDKVERLLKLVKLEHVRSYLPHQLSGGMKQRVAIARALAMEPIILLMDEPFNALDTLTRYELHLELLKIWQLTNKTIVFVTHSISEAIFLSDRIIVLTEQPGRITKVININLGRPRNEETKTTEDYNKLYSEILNALKNGKKHI